MNTITSFCFGSLSPLIIAAISHLIMICEMRSYTYYNVIIFALYALAGIVMALVAKRKKTKQNSTFNLIGFVILILLILYFFACNSGIALPTIYIGNINILYITKIHLSACLLGVYLTLIFKGK